MSKATRARWREQQRGHGDDPLHRDGDTNGTNVALLPSRSTSDTPTHPNGPPRDVRFQRVRLNPEMARDLIMRNAENQRHIYLPHVERMARDITAGRWRFDGAPIRISKSGRMLDGQHRCHAVIAANESIDVIVVTGLDDEVMTTIDSGRSRTPGDRLHMKGEDHANKKAAAAGLIHWIESGDLSDRSVRPFFELEDALERHREAIEWAVRAIPSRIEPGIPSGGKCIYGCFAYVQPIDPHRAELLTHKFVTGQDLTKGDPIKALRNIVANAFAPPRETLKSRVLRTLRCLEAGFTGERLGVAKLEDDADEVVLDRVKALRAEAGA